MAKISRKPVYPQDENITPRDYLIGTNVNTPNLRTQTYSVESLINLANEVVGNSTSTFKFTTDRLITHLNQGFFTSQNDETNPLQTTKLSFNKLTVQGVNVSSAFIFLIENQFFNIKLKNISDVNNIIFLSPSNLIQNEDFITFNVAHFASNGLLIDGETYFLDYASFYYPFNNPSNFITNSALSPYALLEDLVNDKNYVHSQNTAQFTWEVTHNLNKYPSVVVVDSGDSIVVGEVNYLNLNTVVINFNTTFSGKAYFN